MFAAPPVIEARPFARLPDEFRHGHGGRHSVLEGPAFDRAGTLHVVNIPRGQILKVSEHGEFSLFLEYDGEPNGLAFHKDGRLFIADHRNGLMVADPATGAIRSVVDRPRRERFKGLNDLTFAANGDLYFTDQGQSGLHDPTGRLWRLREEKWLDLVLDNIPSPNGLVMAEADRTIYLAVTRGNAVWRVPMRQDGGPGRVGIYIQLSGGAGPDGMALDSKGGLVLAHLGMGSVWLFCPRGRPIAEIAVPKGTMVTNCAFGGPEGRTLFMTEAQTSTIYTAELDVPGAALFSHA
jgi:gluconolactonase